MPPADPTSQSSWPPSEPPRPRTATSLSALANTQSPSEGPAPSLAPPDVSRRRAILPYLALSVLTAAAVVGGLAVYRLESAPKPAILHGTPGMRHTPDGKVVRWRTRATTVHIDSSVDRLGPQARDAIRQAFGTWLEGDAQLPRLTFAGTDRAEARLKADGKNTVLVAPIRIPGHEKDLAVTITFSDEKSGNVVEADVVLNADHAFAFLERANRATPALALRDAGAQSPPEGEGKADPASAGSAEHPLPESAGRAGPGPAPSANAREMTRADELSSCVAGDSELSCGRDVYDVENVVAHEVGHFFGLGEEMVDGSATMYLCTNRCETHKREPTLMDRAAIAWLYPAELEATAADGDGVGCGGAQLGGKRTPGSRAALALCALALFLTHRRRGSRRWLARAGTSPR